MTPTRACLPPDSAALWREVEACIDKQMGMLVLDDTTLDKPYASQMALVSRHWSGKHQAVVQGINLISLVWTDGNGCLPCDFRLYNKVKDGLDKNDHFQAMVHQAQARGFQPSIVAFDRWYSSLSNLKLVRDCGWDWLTRLKSNRQVSVQPGQSMAVADLTIPNIGLVVHLRGYGLIRVFRTVDPHGNAAYWATNRLEMTPAHRKLYADRAWLIEDYHRSIKQFTGIQAGQFRLEISQRNHIGLAIRAFVRLEFHRWKHRLPLFDAKLNIIRQALRLYLAHPTFVLPSTA